MADNIVEIDRKKLPKLRNIFAKNDTKSYFAHMVIDNYIRWYQQDPNLKYVHFFCLNGDFSDGTFVVTDRCSAYADTLNESPENLYRLLQLVDYSKGYVFRGIRSAIRPTILNALKSINVEVMHDDKGLIYFLPKTDALKLDITIPEKVQLKPLTDRRDLEKVNSFWPHSYPDSIFLWQRLANFNLNVGAFLDDGTLVAWILRYPSGMIAALQTDDKVARKGYGSLVTKAFSKMVATMGDDVYVAVDVGNTRSMSLYEKLGFKCISEDTIYNVYAKISQLSDDVGYNTNIKKLAKM